MLLTPYLIEKIFVSNHDLSRNGKYSIGLDPGGREAITYLIMVGLSRLRPHP